MQSFLVFISEQWILVSILLVLIYTFAMTERLKAGKPIGVAEVTSLINGDKGLVLDIRDHSDYVAGHITNALNIPYAELDNRSAELEKHREKVIVIVDKLGQHGGNVGRTLRKEGYEVRRLSGGMGEWLQQNLPVIKG